MSKILEGNGNGKGTNGLLQPAKKWIPQSLPSAPASVAQESQVTFQTHDGLELCGVPVRVTRYQVVFELYNPGTIPRLSEAIDALKILLQGRAIYSGRAVVRSVMDAGSKVVCEATLDESNWIGLNLALALGHDGELTREFESFLKEWQKFYRIRPEFKVVIADLQTFLTDSRIWLDHVEVALRTSSSAAQAKWRQDINGKLASKVVPAIQNLTEGLEEIMNQLEEDLVPIHQAFCRRLLHPLTLCSPFINRTFYKPLGYAGDYEMVNMMFRDPFEGESLYARVMNAYALQLPPIIGHRNRIHYLRDKLEQETLRLRRQRQNARIFNLGCGPAQEIQRFLAETELADDTRFTLADFNQETLRYTARILGDLKNQHKRKAQIQMVERSVYQMLKGAGRIDNGTGAKGDRYDFVYCAGLFDYLPDQVCQRLMEVFYAMLLPGGLLIVTNVDDHPARNQMECFLDWHLMHRKADKMRSLAPPNAAPENIATQCDPSGVNVFMEVRKLKR